ncbi:MAG TPA: UvrD-helicase domain-containing protein [Planctomycetota bacterium]|nr:UvrD-helicase domain-containing protein [Planctomycetota bacterium]
MKQRPPPPDKAERDRALDSRASLAVTAGAGTGKTTLLVEKVLRKVLDEKVKIDRILALTFTEKAANEMKLRLRRELRERGHPELLEPLERAEICTIHSYCAHILRQFPVEAGVSPDVEVDEGPVFARRFEEAWPRWLDRELGPGARRPKQWMELLAKVKLAELRELAEKLCSFGVPDDGRGNGEQLMADYVKELSAKVPKLAPALARQAEPQKTIKGGFLEKAALRLAHDIAKIDEPLVRRAVELMEDFAREFRRDYLRAGYVTFDGILSLVRQLLESKEFPAVREILREAHDYILVDEFQDTDPLQSAIIRKLAEDGKGKLIPGKLFIVGDPKQSIYSFRGADIIAYEGLRQQILDEGGEKVILRTNFRSHGKLIEFVNASFSRLIVQNGRLQPKYHPIEPAADAEQQYAGPAIEAILVENASAEESRDMEAQEIADWIEKRPAELSYDKIAILLRSLVNVGTYLEALRARNIPYVVDGEKYFYNTTEVIDFVNLLRAVANPHDRIAVAGLLRSPYGAASDQEIYERRKGLDYRTTAPWPIFRFLKRWNELSGTIGVTELIDRIFEESYALEIAQSGYHGEQAVANLLKLRQKAADLEVKGGCTLREFLDVARTAVRELEEEGESPLADETLDAVKILSIHKSKGLEFPVVILPDLHRDKKSYEIPVLRYDWPSRTLGVKLGDAMNTGAAALGHLDREREREERRRLLYVALTRAEDRIVLLGSAKALDKEESFLGMLGPDLKAHATVSVKPYQRPPFVPPKPPGDRKTVDWEPFVRKWREREKRGIVTERITSPSKLEEAGVVDRVLLTSDVPGVASRATEVGTICHAVLERLDFKAPEIPKGTDPEAAEILAKFFKSAPFKELAKAEILARELPFLIPRGEQIVQGVIDLVYRAGGKVYVADYKTDKVMQPEDYGLIRDVYTEAVRRVLKVDPGFKLIYLRQGRAVDA